MACETPPLINYFSGALIAIVASLVTAVSAHIFAGKRERQNRKRNFIGLMGGMRLEAERTTGEAYANVFPTRLYELRSESAKIRDDLDSDMRLAFDKAVKALCQLTASQVSDTEGGDSPAGRRRVTEAIDVVINSLGVTSVA